MQAEVRGAEERSYEEGAGRYACLRRQDNMTLESRTASHLGIPLKEYDARITTFLAHYDVMLDEASAAVAALGIERPVFLDLGIGTGALSSRCLAECPDAAVIGIDSDEEMLQLAQARLRQTAPAAPVELRQGNYLDLELPTFDIAIASFSLHHIPDPETKRRLYRRCRSAARPGGGLVIADCFLTGSAALNEVGMRTWQEHLLNRYSVEESRAFMDAWAAEDTYFALGDEVEWLKAAGFRPDVLWRRDLFAVLLCV